MELARQGKILLEEDKARVNQMSIDSLQSMEIKRVMVPVLPTIQFGSLDPMAIEQKGASSTLQEHAYEDEKAVQPDVDDKGWTLVTRRRRRHSRPSSKANKALTRSLVIWKGKEKDVKRNNDCRNLQESRIYHVEEQKDNTRESLCEIASVPTSNEKDRVPTGNEEANVTSIIFTSEDLLLGSTPHNRPLFVTGYANEQKVNRILIDGGSEVNILPLKTLKELGILVDELSNSRLMIQGFNQEGQRALGSLNLEIVIDDMSSRALLYVIDAKTTYNVLLGRPWIHENGVVPSTLHQCFNDMIHGLNPIQKMLKEKGYAVENSKFGLGYSSPTLIRIKINRASSQYIAMEDESSQIVGKFQTFHEKENKTLRVSVFKRLGSQRKQKPQNSHRSKGKMAKSLQNLEEPSDCPHKFGSIIPSRMKRCTDLVIKCGTELRVREHTVVYTRPKEDDEESVASCNHITLIDGDSPEEEEDAEDAPPELEEGVKATVDDLKEINLGTSEDPRPIYISALLSPDEEKAYTELLREYQDVFAWTCKEMPGLDPKVAIRHLAVKKRVRPVKQAHWWFRPDLISLIKIEVNKLIQAGKFSWQDLKVS
ncbi:uncharacterized protein [Coffea arabica]|uniref:Uncharacterized protein n=1 Tax=Coffea arabica TaxID=13443 RepID=A0ABM4X565_COFAR